MSCIHLSLTTNLNFIFRIIKLIWLLTDPSLGCREMKKIHLNHYRYYTYDLKILWVLNLREGGRVGKIPTPSDLETKTSELLVAPKILDSPHITCQICLP